MPLIDFTSFDDVRASVGVSSDEIDDATLSLPLYELKLVAELEDVSLTLVDDYIALQDTDTDSWTPVQKRFNSAARLFATYAVAKQLTISLPLFSPKEQSDSKATLVRYAQDPYKETIKAIQLEYNASKTRLEQAYALVQSSTATAAPVRTFLVAAAPTSDPVTGT